MPTIVAHGLLAAGAFRFADRGRNPGPLGPLAAGALCALPDADVLWWGLTTYGAPWGHRGMTHSLAAAAVIGTAAAFALRRRLSFRGGTPGLALFLSLVVASHGLLDALTDGGRGVAFFSPFDTTRHFFPVTPIPVAPITFDLTSPGLWDVFAVEALLIGPAAFALWTWHAPPFRGCRVVAVVALLASAVVWGMRIAS